MLPLCACLRSRAVFTVYEARFPTLSRWVNEADTIAIAKFESARTVQFREVGLDRLTKLTSILEVPLPVRVPHIHLERVLIQCR